MHRACCGYDCGNCPVFRATGDEAAQQRLARIYATAERPLRPEQMRCLGCRSSEERPCVMCEGCAIRQCAMGRGVENCGRCPAYPCAQLDEALPEGGESRKWLDEVFSSLILISL